MGQLFTWNIKCLFGYRHDLRVIEKVSPYTEKLTCDKCGGFWGINYDVRAILRWHLVEPFYEQMKDDN